MPATMTSTTAAEHAPPPPPLMRSSTGDTTTTTSSSSSTRNDDDKTRAATTTTTTTTGAYATVQTLRPVRGRIVVVGDLHGCTRTLQRMLAQVHFRPPAHDGSGDADMCVFVGDIVNKGPDSWGTVRLLRDMGAAGVLGNHDAKLLRLVGKWRRGEALDDDEASSSLLPLARTCDDDVYAYLSRLPHILHIPQHHVLVVHAGVDPTVPLHAQDAHAVMHLRNLAPVAEYTAAETARARKAKPQTTKKRDKHTALALSATYAALERDTLGRPWAAVWSEAVQSAVTRNDNDDDDGARTDGGAVRARCLPEFAGVTVVFGHDARRRLQQYPYAVGVDTGCAYGGALSAFVLPERNVVSVPGWNGTDDDDGDDDDSAAAATATATAAAAAPAVATPKL